MKKSNENQSVLRYVITAIVAIILVSFAQITTKAVPKYDFCQIVSLIVSFSGYRDTGIPKSNCPDEQAADDDDAGYDEVDETKSHYILGIQFGDR